MATPPDSGGIFLSSSPTRYSSGPVEEVNLLLSQAQTVDYLSPTIENFITTHRDAFFKTFERRIILIRSRSQAFQDFHVTVFDKVLLELTQNGHHLNHPAAIQYFCEEFLAIPTNISTAQDAAILSDAVIAPVPTLPAHAMTPPDTHRDSISAQGAIQDSPRKKSLFGRELHPKSVFLATLAGAVGPAATRLWTVYDQAKQEFLAVTDQDSAKKQAVAKFLRDTAENTLHCLRDQNVDRHLLEELETTFNIAKQAAAALHGGRKRKFDRPAARQSIEWTPVTQTTQDYSFDAGPENWMRDNDPRAFKEPTRGEFAGYTRALIQHQRLTPPRNVTQGRRNAALELFPTEHKPKRKRKNQQPRPQPGRGHSNIPFGYSRPVDSYQPEF